MDRLRRAGALESVHGRYGGFRLADDAANLRIGNIVLGVEEAILGRPLDSPLSDPSGLEALASHFDQSFIGFVETLNRQSLADFMDIKSRITDKRSRNQRSSKSPASAAVGRKAL